jgi:hypothetical protein
MILELRQRHRRMWLALAVVLPGIVIVAWFSRRPAAVMERLPPEFLQNDRARPSASPP